MKKTPDRKTAEIPSERLSRLQQMLDGQAVEQRYIARIIRQMAAESAGASTTAWNEVAQLLGFQHQQDVSDQGFIMTIKWKEGIVIAEKAKHAR